MTMLRLWLIGLAACLCACSDGGSPRAEELRIGAATQGGAFYPVGQTVSTLVNKYADGLTMVPIATEGSVQNPRLVNIGEDDVGITNNSLAVLANEGGGVYQRVGPMQLRTLGALHPSVLHMMTLESSPIGSIADLKGKRVAVGPAGGGTLPLLMEVLALEGLTLKDIVPSFLSYGDGFSELADGNVDAAFALSGYPASAVMQAKAGKPLKFIRFSEDELARILARFPSFEAVTIAKDVYDTPEDGVLISDLNLLIVDASMDEARAYEITRAVYGHMDEFREELALARQIDPARSSSLGIPLHPGAARYFGEQD